MRVRDDLIAYYKQKGDEERFTAICNDLRADEAMGKPEMTALAKQITGTSARPQDAALKKIWSWRQSLVMFKTEIARHRGRSAA
jgi:hypothetical protein